ncbi:MAG: pca operon transcription factor PcaQ [Gammaproteobacteria bacterium]|uniref:LysR family transcriptional regulator, pca operon transcriptional activator n=1 Tax=Pseudomonas cuatrocienegasensis TaxID=543360 RepID=A0ABY1BEF5_9PSED|nr:MULTISPECIES: pca operon transcription factor PcaQ [Pseudomonas]MBU1329768.1 pca operon transcription factor PcaQ [Gammaproteobacteria bacterium]MBU1490276.1 pca operon transcription factor PcaQ [Gammaproteobacteria bacterium]MBU2065422.1 pca operon transcription factor PcaQ [Gammaproteobacteria bacterium]MBU2139095.1 pca operon transcription factor PcaQ [Gammaproteobacteria bacterium]MBU2215447.1 pca operon transcription factor PcaQ [Gammaproteobacteria bacterium]
MNIDTRIKFRHLVCFLEVARQGSLARAADQLAVSQPAISKTLKELETLLGTSLFERSKSGARLSEAGVAFMRYAGPSVQALREGVSSLRAGEYSAATLRLGVLSTVESLLVPEVVRRLHARHPALVASVVTGPSAHLLAQLHLGELDLVVGRMTDSPQIQGLTFEHLYSESMTLVVRAGHPLLDGVALRERLQAYPLVVPLAGTTIRKYADALFVQCGISPPRQRLETLSITLSRRYVQSSDALWIAPLDAVQLDLRSGELAELDLGVVEPGGSVGICRNTAVPLSLAAHGCVEVLREVGLAYRTGSFPE